MKKNEHPESHDAQCCTVTMICVCVKSKKMIDGARAYYMFIFSAMVEKNTEATNDTKTTYDIS